MSEKTNINFREELQKRVFGALFGLVFMAGSAGVVWVTTDWVDQAQAVWSSPQTSTDIIDRLEELKTSVAGLGEEVRVVRREVAALKAPTKIFEISVVNSGPIEGFCVELEPCDIRLKIRRLPETISCRIVAGSVRWAFFNPRTDTISQVRRLDTPSGRNLGIAWELTDLRIVTPSGLAPTSDFYFSLQYVDCPGVPAGSEPIPDASPRMPFVIHRVRPTP